MVYHPKYHTLIMEIMELPHKYGGFTGMPLVYTTISFQLRPLELALTAEHQCPCGADQRSAWNWKDDKLS